MADLQKVAFGGEEIQYDKLPGLGSRFALGSRDVQKFVHVPFNVAALDTKPAGPALEDITAGSVQGSDAIETEVISLSCSRSQCYSQLSPLNTPYPLQAKAQAKPKLTSEEYVLPSSSATPISGTVEEQFISMPDSPKAAATKTTSEGAEQANKALAEQATAASPAGRELPWNQASAHIRSPLLRLHTGDQDVEHAKLDRFNVQLITLCLVHVLQCLWH